MVRNRIFFLLFLFVMIPQVVFAHALLERANPAPDSQLSSSPSDISLTFNERLERELYFIKVFNSQGHSVTETPTEMSQNQKELHLSLPPLEDGIYTVTYSVLSADGHPVRGSYVISVGNTQSPGKTHQAEHVHGEHQTGTLIGIFGIRILYFLTLLWLTGWIAWGICHSFESIELRQSYQVWTSYLQRAYLIALLAMIFVQLGDLLTDWGLKEITALLFNTSAGLSLTLSLVLSIFGFFVLQRKKWLDAIWVIMLLTAKSISGHAMAFEPPIRTILLDVVHLLAAAIWIGGLGYLLLFWKSHREAIMRFLPFFSKAALASLIVLTITGTLSTLIFLPKLSYLLETTWGILLLVKVSLVGLVVIVGAILRHGIKKNLMNQVNIGLKLDIGLMTLIVAIVGVFTFQSPIPANQPLYWHEMGKSYMLTTQITPNVPGANHFSVDVSLANRNLQIKNVEFSLKYQDDTDIAPIKVPLRAENTLQKSTAGHNEYRFVSDGPYLPFSGKWTIEVRVMDSEDNETVFTKDFITY